MKVPLAVFNCKKSKNEKYKFFSQKKRSNFQEKKINKRKDFTPKKKTSETRRRKANFKITFWF